MRTCAVCPKPVTLILHSLLRLVIFASEVQNNYYQSLCNSVLLRSRHFRESHVLLQSRHFRESHRRLWNSYWVLSCFLDSQLTRLVHAKFRACRHAQTHHQVLLRAHGRDFGFSGRLDDVCIGTSRSAPQINTFAIGKCNSTTVTHIDEQISVFLEHQDRAIFMYQRHHMSNCWHHNMHQMHTVTRRWCSISSL